MKTDKEILREASIELIHAIETLSGEDPEMFKEALSIIDSATQLAELKSIFDDMIEWSMSVKGKNLIDLNLKLINKNLPTLTQMRHKDFKSFLKILTRGNLSSKDDLLLVENYLEELAKEHIPSEQSEYAKNIVIKYKKAEEWTKK